MFFTRGLNVVASDEGFSVKVMGRVGLRYEEGPRRLFVDSELLAGPAGIGVNGTSIKHWDPPHADELIDPHRRLVILDNIRRAFRFQGFDISIQWPEIAIICLPVDTTQGYPSGDDLFFECMMCGTIVPTLPADNTPCICGNLHFDGDDRHVVVRDPGHLRLFAIDLKCQCLSIALLEGPAARRYADEHLVQLRVDAEKGQTIYRCSSTGYRWIMDDFQGEAPGSPRWLRRL